MDKKLFNAQLKSYLLGNKDAFMDTANGNNGQTQPGTDGGYLIDNELQELFELGGAGVDLRSICSVYNVGTRAGSIPVINYENQANLALVNFDECDAITEGKAAFTSVEYALSPLGKVVPVSLQLLREANSDVLAIVGKGFGIVHKRGTNTAICAAVVAATSAEAASDVNDAIDKIKKAVIELPAAMGTPSIVMGKAQWAKFACAKDLDGNYLLARTANGEALKEIEGAPVYVVETSECANILVGDFTALAHIQIGGIEVASSTEAGFGRAAVMVRALQYQTEAVVHAGCFKQITLA